MQRLIRKILREEITPKNVHDAADEVGMVWDDNPEFMALSKKITGKEHIDDMTSQERKKLIKKILREDEMQWIKDIEAIESPQVDVNKGYVIWLDDITEEEREMVGEWLFKKIPQCKDLPFPGRYWADKRVMMFDTSPCGVGGLNTKASPEQAREAYEDWSKRYTPLDPIKILRGVNINESDDMDWIRNVSNIMPFDSLEVNKHYKIHKINKSLIDAVNICVTGDINEASVSKATSVMVRDSHLQDWDGVNCVEEDNAVDQDYLDSVLKNRDENGYYPSLELRFYKDEEYENDTSSSLSNFKSNLGTFWVMEGMVELLPIE